MSRDLANWNGLPGGDHRLPDALLVADDAVGGFFAINGNAFDGPTGNVLYLPPDTLAWKDCGMGYADLTAALVIGATLALVGLLAAFVWWTPPGSIGPVMCLAMAACATHDARPNICRGCRF